MVLSSRGQSRLRRREQKHMSSTTMLMNVDDVAGTLRVSPHTVRRWAGQRKLRKLKLGTRTLFDPADVAQFVEQHVRRFDVAMHHTDRVRGK